MQDPAGAAYGDGATRKLRNSLLFGDAGNFCLPRDSATSLDWLFQHPPNLGYAFEWPLRSFLSFP